MTLSNKYRPKEFNELIDQEVACTVLSNQIERNTFCHANLFIGPAGCGKTSAARIFSSKIHGETLELDCASHNGVADIKEIIEHAKTSSIVYKYKVFILDECHMLTSQAWAALLITLEETLPRSIFIFCTTDAQKIPNTILSRVQELNFLPIKTQSIFERIMFICEKEELKIEKESAQCIAKSAHGNLRQSLTNLDKCLLYGSLELESVCRALNVISDNIMEEVTNAYTNKDVNKIVSLIENIYNNGYNLHMFVRQFLDYSLKGSNLKLVDCILTIMQDIRYDDMPKNLIIARLLTK